MENSDYQYTMRIKLICKFLDKNGGTKEEMLAAVNDGLEDLKLKTIEYRTLRECLKRLREGNFNHTLKDSLSTRDQLFKINISNKKYYSWDSKSRKPIFGDMDIDERFTVPFLVGILNKYQNIPAVQKVIDRLPDLFHLTEDEMSSSSAIVHLNPDLYDYKKENFQEQVIKCVIKTLSHIHAEQCITFNYSQVNKSDSHKNFVIAPIQIRFYENYYYLIGKDFARDEILQFRVDHITSLRVESLLDDNDIPVTFDLKAYSNTIKKRFDYSFGIWVNKDWKNYKIDIEFSNWAAAYVKHLRFHPSQKIISEDKTNSKIIIRYQLQLDEERSEGQPPNERNSELAFFLGRFREFARILLWERL